MRKAMRVSAIVVAMLLVFILCAAIYVKSFLPSVGAAPELHIASTPEKVNRGEYLASHVMVCMDCHSTRQWNYFGGPVQKNTSGRGGERFDRNAGFPGVIYSSNITPAGIGDWTDGEIFRAITAGVRKNGKPIFPVMPYKNYGLLDRSDIEAVICYLRTLPSQNNKTPESDYDFPMNFIINTIPQKAALTTRPDSLNITEYGKYLVTASGCGECHTPFEKGKYDTSLFLAGGRQFQVPAGIVTTPNLTPDTETGTGGWSRDRFLNKFTAYRDSSYAHRPIDFSKDFATVMPWPVYSGMSDGDLGAIYQYLQSLTPIHHPKDPFKPRLHSN